MSSHVIFNTQIMSNQVLSSLFFRNIVFVAEDAAVRGGVHWYLDPGQRV